MIQYVELGFGYPPKNTTFRRPTNRWEEMSPLNPLRLYRDWRSWILGSSILLFLPLAGLFFALGFGEIGVGFGLVSVFLLFVMIPFENAIQSLHSNTEATERPRWVEMVCAYHMQERATLRCLEPVAHSPYWRVIGLEGVTHYQRRKNEDVAHSVFYAQKAYALEGWRTRLEKTLRELATDIKEVYLEWPLPQEASFQHMLEALPSWARLRLNAWQQDKERYLEELKRLIDVMDVVDQPVTR
jgi:hypothetical protein